MVVMAEAICWRYSRVPVRHPRIMHPQEHRKGPGAQTSEDAGGVKGAFGGTLCIQWGS